MAIAKIKLDQIVELIVVGRMDLTIMQVNSKGRTFQLIFGFNRNFR